METCRTGRAPHHPRRVRCVKRAAGLAVVAVMAVACVNGGGGAPAHVHWLLYGDSLSEGAGPYLASYGSVGNRYLRSTAPCNWVGGLDGDAGAYAPDIVLMQFLGNPPPCLGGRDPATAYREDLTTIARFWLTRQVPVVIVLSPKTPTDQYAWARLAEEQVATDLGLTVNNAGASVELPGEVFTYFLPCLSEEDAPKGCGAEVAGQIRVRASDGVHFGNSGSGYSSGAFRFAHAMAG